MEFVPGGLGAHGAPGIMRRIDTSETRQLIGLLERVASELDACWQRLSAVLRLLALEAPGELYRILEDLRGLGRELRGRLEVFEAAEAQAQSAAASVAAAFAGLFAAAHRPPEQGGRTLRDSKSRGASDARKVMGEARATGVFDLAHPEKAAALVADAARRARTDPAYAAAFLKTLDPENLRWLLEHGTQDPCDLSDIVAQASRSGIGLNFLKKTIGNDRFDAPRRAALLAGCDCPTVTFQPAWANTLVQTLYRGRDAKPGEPADTRTWYRERAAIIISQHLAHPPPGMAKETEDALQRLIAFAAKPGNELDAAGKRALAEAIVANDLIDDIARCVEPGAVGVAVGDLGFGAKREDLLRVLPDLMADPEARRTVLEAAQAYAATRIAVAVATQGKEARESALAQVGALFGALASEPYSTQAAVDIRKATGSAVRSLLDTAGGTLIDAAKAGPVVSLVVEGGKAILFDLAGTSADQAASERELKEDREKNRAQVALVADLQADLFHLTYVAVLSDPDQRAALTLNLTPDAIPEVTPELAESLNLPVTSRREWQAALFPDGQLGVPHPSDGRNWALFRAWAGHVNPDLAGKVRELTDVALDGMVRVKS
jgi:hypothetical protein